MHYSKLNRKGGKDDEFRPQDFLDMDSGDSDNEILAKLKQEDGTAQQAGGLLRPLSPLKQLVPQYMQIQTSLVSSGNNIEEQTGYSNSPKFSIYRLNNPSHLKDNFEDHVNTA